MKSSKLSSWPGYIQLATMALFTGLLVLLPTQVVLAQEGGANECDAARREVANNPLDYKSDHIYDSLLQKQKDIIGHKKKGKLEIENLSFNETFVGGCTRAGVNFYYERDDKLGDDKLVGPLKSKNGEVIEADVYVIHNINNLNPNVVHIGGGDIYEGADEQLHEMRLWSKGDQYKRAGTDTTETGYSSRKYIKWATKNDGGRYTVVLCIKPNDCLPSKEEPQQNPSTNKKQPPQQKPATNNAPVTKKKPTESISGYEIKYNIRSETEGYQDWPPNASLKMIAGTCNFNPLKGDIQLMFNSIYSKQCIELVNAPDWRLKRVSWKLAKKDQQLLITGIIESTKKPEFTSLKVHVQIRGSQDFPTKQCALKYELFNVDDFSVGYSNKLIRKKEGLLTASVSPNNIYWKNVAVKLSPLKKSDCNLENPSAIYYPPASENEPKFTVDATGVVTIAPVYVYSNKPDITIAIMSYMGTADAGNTLGSQSLYPMQMEKMREAAQAFLQIAFTTYNDVANKIHIISPDSNGSLNTLGTEVAADINLPIKKALEYTKKLEFLGRDYSDTHVYTLAQQLFSKDSNRSAHQIIVFGRSGKANDSRYCAKLPDAVLEIPSGDSVAFIDFVSSDNKVAKGAPLIEGSDDYPTVDCEDPRILHWLIYPESESPSKGRGIQKKIFNKFLDKAQKSMKYIPGDSNE